MTTYAERFTHAVAVLCGAQPPADMVDEWIANIDVNGEHRLQGWVLSQAATPSWAQGIVVLDAAHVLANNPEEGMEHEDRPPAAAVQEGRDWSLLAATQESLREHMAEIKRLKAAQPVKTYSGGKPWPVAPAPDPAPIIQQLVTALEGSGTRMRSDQWYVEIEAVAAGKFYLNSKGEGL
jgi:hypothetical protein